MLKTDCPHCRTPLKAPDEYAGKSPKCPRCKRRVPARHPDPRRATPVAAATAAAPKSAEDSLLDELLAEVERKTPASGAKAKPKRAAAAAPAGAPAVTSVPVSPILVRKPRKSMTPTIITVAVSVAVVLGAAAYLWKMLQEKRETARVTMEVQDLEGRLAEIREKMSRGDALVKEAKYAEALKVLERAEKDADALYQRLQQATEVVRAPSALQLVESGKTKVRSVFEEARSKSKNEEIINVSKGLVRFDNQWVTPEKREELLKQKMIAEGKAWREDLKQWMTDDEYKKAKGMVFYREQWYTKEEFDQIKKQEVAQQEREKKALADAKAREEAAKKRREDRDKQAAERKADRDRKFPADAPRWLLDDFEDGDNPWKAQTWGNPCTTSVLSHKGSKRLQVAIERGLQDKAAIGRPMDMDLSSRDRLTLDVDNQSKDVIQVAVAVQSDQWYESRVELVRVGESRVQFNLRAGDFKSEATGWRHTTAAKNLDAVKSVYLLFYTKRDGLFYLDNVAAERVQ